MTSEFLDMNGDLKLENHCRKNVDLIKILSEPAPGAADLRFPTQHSQSFLNQCAACLWKQHKSYWRNTYYTAIRIFFTMVTALLFGTIFWGLGQRRYRE